jgi:cytochrome c biogenesis protein CcmG, thiol:disulfide interchange protein DsbE
MRIRVLLPIALLVLVVAGCGDSGRGSTLTREEIGKALAGAPPALAGLHDQAGALIGGGVGAFRARMAKLRGHPVVVNRWAAWCQPCRAEFGVLARVSVKEGKRVAFLGVDAKDVRDSAAGFLRRHLVPYPSYEDPSSKISKSLKATLGMPITNFYDARGKLVFQHPGPYTSEKALLADIARYATT